MLLSPIPSAHTWITIVLWQKEFDFLGQWHCMTYIPVYWAPATHWRATGYIVGKTWPQSIPSLHPHLSAVWLCIRNLFLNLLSLTRPHDLFWPRGCGGSDILAVLKCTLEEALTQFLRIFPSNHLNINKPRLAHRLTWDTWPSYHQPTIASTNSQPSPRNRTSYKIINLPQIYIHKASPTHLTHKSANWINGSHFNLLNPGWFHV